MLRGSYSSTRLKKSSSGPFSPLRTQRPLLKTTGLKVSPAAPHDKFFKTFGTITARDSRFLITGFGTYICYHLGIG